MKYPINPSWLFLLHTYAAYTPSEVAKLGDWSESTVSAALKRWKLEPLPPSARSRKFRALVDSIVTTKGHGEARRTIAGWLGELATLRPPPRWAPHTVKVRPDSSQPCHTP